MFWRRHHGFRQDGPPKQPRHKRPWNWMRTPSWWIREMMTRPQRAETRLKLREIIKTPIRDVVDHPQAGPADPPLFPLPKKPHLYYW